MCVGLCDKGPVGSGASVVWTINCWAPAQLALFTINSPGGTKGRSFLFQGTALNYVFSSPWFQFNE